MKKLALLALALSAAAPSVFAGTDVSVSIGINQPGVYGRINIGNEPPPVLVSPQPVLIAPAPAVVQQPIYLYVPEAHQKNWRHYCKQYNACGQPVYFVKEQWVRDRYKEHENERHARHDDDHDRKHGHGDHGDDHRDDRR